MNFSPSLNSPQWGSKGARMLALTPSLESSRAMGWSVCVCVRVVLTCVFMHEAGAAIFNLMSEDRVCRSADCGWGSFLVQALSPY